jgi:hypothetical protein
MSLSFVGRTSWSAADVLVGLPDGDVRRGSGDPPHHSVRLALKACGSRAEELLNAIGHIAMVYEVAPVAG